MIIRAARPDSGFLIVRNEVIRDDRLSLKARGLLLLILSYPDNWKTDSDTLAAACKEGRTAILSALKELREVGYMRQTKTRDDKGQITTHTYIYDYPESENLTPVPTRGNSASPLVAPEAGFPTSDNPTPKEELEKKTRRTTTTSDLVFEAFYRAYPRHVGKGQAQRAWKNAIKKAEPNMITEAARLFAVSVVGKDPQYVAHPATWLNGERWADEPDRVESVRPRGMPSTW
jgi:hypothetical protein